MLEKFAPQSRNLLAAQALRPQLAPEPHFEHLMHILGTDEGTGDITVPCASQRYLCNYVEHWTKIVPVKLASIASPDEWRIDRLLDETKTRLRKPKVRVGVTINAPHAFELRCESIVRPSALCAAEFIENERRDATDFKSFIGCSLVYLRSGAYPIGEIMTPTMQPGTSRSPFFWHLSAH
jgi:hypothetical protein